MRLQRAYRALSECNAAIVQATAEQELLTAICRTLVEVGGYRLAWVGEPIRDETQTVRPLAFAGSDEGYLSSVHISWGDTAEGHGPTGVAIRTGRTSVNRDSATNPFYAPWRDEALRHGYASSIALPVIASGKTLGSLTVYSTVPDAFDEEETSLLEGLARSLGHGLEALRTRKELRDRDEQLRASAKMEALGQLAAGLVHDLNNLLMVIGGCSTELKNALGGDHPQSALVRELEGAVDSAFALTRQVLAFGGTGGGNRRVISLGATLHDIAPLLRRSLGKSVELAVEMSGEIPPVLANPTQLEEALVNLAINARDAMDGTGRCTVRLRRATEVPASAIPMRASDEPMVELAVSDTGCGMPPEVMRQLFQPFFTTKPPGRGTGLGLPMVRSVIEQNGGRVAVESEVGRGTTFRLFLPAAR